MCARSCLLEIDDQVGGCEALFGALMSLVSPGKNVVLLEPAFDCYDKQVAMAGGTCRYVPVRAPEGAADGEPIAANDFVVDMAEFEAGARYFGFFFSLLLLACAAAAIPSHQRANSLPPF